MSDFMFSKINLRRQHENRYLHNDPKDNALLIHPSKTLPLLRQSRRARHLMERNKWYGISGLIAGILFGFLLCFWSKPIFPCSVNNCCLKQQLRAEIQHELDMDQEPNVDTLSSHVQKKQVLIGVMTAAKFIDNRALAVWRTWAQTINGDVVFFSSEGSASSFDLPLVALPDVTDAYPPQKKSFMMAKYLHDFGADKYKFFMRVDDDVYIHGERLDHFLAKLNHTKALYIGQAGTGTAEELGQLSLNPDENFCMGGPGIIFSAETLRRMVPHISYCLQHLLTNHEDVELGRCIRMFAGISCTWNYEMQKLFHHSYTYRTESHVFPYDRTGPEMYKAITLHPVKVPATMYQIHNEMVTHKTAELDHQTKCLRNEIQELERLAASPPSDSRQIKQSENNQSSHELLPWTFLTRKSQFSHDMFSVKRNHEGAWKLVLKRALDFTISHFNVEALARGRLVDHPELIYGCRRFHPLNGIQLLLHLKMSFQRIRGKPMKTQISKQVFLEIPAGLPILREIQIHNDETIHLILPLSGKLKEFQRFLAQFELVCGTNAACDLLVLLYDSQWLAETLHLIHRSVFREKIRTLNAQGVFSRAIALHQGVEAVEDNDLMMFIDVDIHFDNTALYRVRQHTKLNTQAYFPIVFNQYDSHMVCGMESCPVDRQSPEDGSFRFFGFGITALYKADYVKCGGFDLNIRGWGKEDVDLYTKVLKSGLKVFRAADPGIVHIYHPKICDKTLNADQSMMCLNSKASSFASKRSLAKIYFQRQSSTIN